MCHWPQAPIFREDIAKPGYCNPNNTATAYHLLLQRMLGDKEGTWRKAPVEDLKSGSPSMVVGRVTD